MKENFYRPSGKFTGIGVIFLFVWTILAGAFLAIPYLFLIRICPFIYLNFLTALLYGLGIGYTASVFCKTFKIRNIPLASVILGLSCLIATYIRWSFFLSYIFTDFQSYTDIALDIALDPASFWNGVLIVNEYGTWGWDSLNGNVTGIMLWLIWLGEIALIMLPAYVFMLSKIKIPFIEDENAWAQKDPCEYQFDFDYFSEKETIMENPDAVLNYPVRDVSRSIPSYVALTLYHSEDFYECYYEIVEKRYNAKNKRFDSGQGMRYLKTSPEFFERLAEKFHRRNPGEEQNQTVSTFTTVDGEKYYGPEIK